MRCVEEEVFISNFPKNIYKSIKIDINVFPTNRDGLNILPDVYGVNLETNTGCILEKTNIPSEINDNLVPLGHILANLPQGDGGESYQKDISGDSVK